ncbi:MAG: DUF933 domain-containing protein [Candidatus Margulisiibacteriota bacterium]
MKIVLTGMPQAGSQQLFSLLTGISSDQVIQKPMEAHLGICEVKDPRIVKLTGMYQPTKTTFTKIEYTLLPDFLLSGPSKNLILGELKNADEICFIANSATASEDVGNFCSELILNDLILVEKRLETLAKDQKKKFQQQKEVDKVLMEKIKPYLEASKVPDMGQFSEEEKKLLRTYQLLTLKPSFIIINTPEDKLLDTSVIDEISHNFNLPAIALNILLEEELLALPDNDRREYMQEIGIEEPAINKMTRIVYEELGMISFFTVGEDEVRAWPIRKGSTAAEAGGVIHSDIAKGFVRAEHMTYTDLVELGSEARVKEAGKFSLKGRDYIVEDGDVMSFRFNV